MTAYIAHDTLVFIWEYLREGANKHQSVTLRALRKEAVRMSAKERRVDHTTEHRNLKIALGLDPIVGGCGNISDADKMLQKLIEADSEKKMLEILTVLRHEHPRAANF